MISGNQVKVLAREAKAAMEGTKTRMTEIGVAGIAAEPRSPEYLAKYVADEVARWEGPIKDGGLQVD